MDSPTKSKIPQFSRKKRTGKGALHKNSSNKLSKNTLNQSETYLLIGGEPQLRGDGEWNLTEKDDSGLNKHSRRRNMRNNTTSLNNSRAGKLNTDLHSSGALNKAISKYNPKNSKNSKNAKNEEFGKIKVNRMNTEGPPQNKYIDGVSSDEEETVFKKFRPSKKSPILKDDSSHSYSFSDNSFDEIKKFDQIRTQPSKIKKKELIQIFSSVLPRAKDLILDLKKLKSDMIQINNNIQKFLDKMDGKLAQTYTCKRCFKKFKTSDNTQVRIPTF